MTFILEIIDNVFEIIRPEYCEMIIPRREKEETDRWIIGRKEWMGVLSGYPRPPTIIRFEGKLIIFPTRSEVIKNRRVLPPTPIKGWKGDRLPRHVSPIVPTKQQMR
jgi:hypothetical protein